MPKDPKQRFAELTPVQQHAATAADPGSTAVAGSVAAVRGRDGEAESAESVESLASRSIRRLLDARKPARG